MEKGIVRAPWLTLALFSNSLCLFGLLWGQGQEPREQEEETGEVRKVREFYGARVVCTTHMSCLRRCQMLVLSPWKASPPLPPASSGIGLLHFPDGASPH